jgi:DNA-binding NarL/FixJ family response regulator
MRILLADSQPKLRYALRLILERQAEFVVVGEASNDIETIRMAEHLDPDIVLMEVKLPGLDGLKTADRIKRDHLAKEVIILTIRNSAEIQGQAAKFGLHDIVAKGAGPDKLLAKIREVQCRLFSHV